MEILAVDLGKFNTMCCSFDSNPKKHSFLTATTTEKSSLSSLKATSRPHRHGGQRTVGWGNDLAQRSDTKQSLSLITKTLGNGTTVKRKTDKDDVLVLARMYGSMNELFIW